MSDLMNRRDEIWHRRALKLHFKSLQDTVPSEEALRLTPLPPSISLEIGREADAHPSSPLERMVYSSLQAGIEALDELGVFDDWRVNLSGFHPAAGGRWCYYRGVPTAQALAELIGQGVVDFMTVYDLLTGEKYLLDYVVDDPLDGTYFEVEHHELSSDLAEFLTENDV